MTDIVNENVNEADVIRYLEAHLNFFEHHSDLLKKMVLKHDSGRAISLIERQNHILRSDNSTLIDQLNTFIAVAKGNDKIFMNLQGLIVDLLACDSLNAIAQKLSVGLTQHFDVDEAHLVLVHRPNSDGDIWLHCDKETLATHFPTSLNELTSECGAFDTTARQLLFGDANIESVAVGAIAIEGECVGLLALGSESASHFDESTDTLFLSHLTKILSQLLVRF